MHVRLLLLVLAILAVAVFAALNWSDVMRVSPLSFGPVVVDAPLGAILLGLLALSVVVFAAAAASLHTRGLIDARQHHKSLEAQRNLADRAEGSRFTELRTQLDEIGFMIAARLAEIEDRLDRRTEPPRDGPVATPREPARPHPPRATSLHDAPWRVDPWRDDRLRAEVGDGPPARV